VTLTLDALLSGLLGAVIGSALSLFFGLMQDRVARRREKIVSHLIDAYLRLEHQTSRGNSIPDKDDFEAAFAEIYLFGDQKSVELAKFAADRIEARQATDLKPLLANMRQQLRSELNLERTDHAFFSLRLMRD
jgi:hypothetical protein